MGEKLLAEIRKNEIPKHVAIIMDGNGRWATKRRLARTEGHKEGVKRVVEIVEAANKLNIKYLTLYAFSTENWKRPQKEIDTLMNLLIIFVNKELKKLEKNNVKLNVLGDIEKLPIKTKNAIKKSLRRTENNTGLVVNIALNYGGRSEIIRAVKKICLDYESQKIKQLDINEELFTSYLYTKNQPDPDLLIRPSGELRISNFLIYQIAYTEFYFSDILWPDFIEIEFYKAILDFQKRNRRFGGI